ncbi:MAG: hypothetical protein WCO98_01715 [bacterium]
MLIHQNIIIFLSNLQYNLFPQIEDAIAAALTDEHYKAIKVLEIIKVEDYAKSGSFIKNTFLIIQYR